MSAEFSALSDTDLVQRTAGGDREALELLLERHAGTALRAAWSVLGRREDALDAAQEALIQAATSVRTAKAPVAGGSFQAFVSVIAQRVAVNQLRSAARRRRREETVAARAESG